MFQFLVPVVVQHSETNVDRRATRQFSLRSLFVLLTLIAFSAAWLVAFRRPLAQFGYYPGVIGLASIALAVVVPFIVRRAHACSTAWTLLAMSLQITCFNIAYTMLEIVRVADTSDGIWPRDWMQETFNGCIVSSLTLPIFALIPVLVYLFAHHRLRSRRFAFWLIASIAACVLATTGLALAMSYTIGTLIHT